MFSGFFERIEVSETFIFCEGWFSVEAIMMDEEALSRLNVIIRKSDQVIAEAPVTDLYERPDLAPLAELNIAKGFRLLVSLCSPLAGAITEVVPFLSFEGTEHPLQQILGPQTFQARGGIEIIHWGGISGWVFDPDALRRKFKPVLVIDDELEIELDLVESRPNLPDIFTSVQPKIGFRLGLRELALLARGANSEFTLCDGREHSFTLLSRTCEVSHQTFTFDYEVRGKLERHDGNTIIGWASCGNFPDEVATVELLINGTRYSTVRASVERKDLINKGYVRSGGGFHFELPQEMPIESDEVAVTARLQNSDKPLPGSPMLLSGRIPRQRDFRRLLGGLPNVYPRVAIIIPIYNAAEELEQCIQSVVKHTRGFARLILIDDASPDPRVQKVLEPWRGWANIEILANEKNLGFTKTVNRGIRHADQDDVIFLNSDTIVTHGWLEGLQTAAYTDRTIATTTALSNNAGAFSVPDIGVKNEFPAWFEIEDCGRLVRQSSPALMPAVPTGNGFCMFVKRTCLNDIGPLDEEAFPRGYGEENDFCMRAGRAGYINIVDDRTFIYHKRSASFLEEKDGLYEAGRQIIKSRYPEYARLTSVYSEDPDFKAIRWRIRNALELTRARGGIPRPRILFVISTQSGGTPQTNRDLMGALSDRYEPWVLRSDSKLLELSRFDGQAITIVKTVRLDRGLAISSHSSVEYDEQVADWLIKFAFELVHIRHIAWHGLGLTRVCDRLSIPVVYSFHDFYTVCPTIKLLDNHQVFCGGKCTESEGDCKGELWPPHTIPPLKHQFVRRWQELMSRSLEYCDAFVTTSEGSKQIILSNFPAITEKPFAVIPHGRTFKEMHVLSSRPSRGEHLRVLIPGNISAAKGGDFVTRVAELDVFEEIEFHVLGDAEAISAKRNIILHGKYNREDFADRVAAIKPHLGAVFSIWPETYCHTLTEMWACGLPVVGFDVGAVGERIKKYEAGWLVDRWAEPADLLEFLLKLKRNPAEFRSKIEKAIDWQQSYGKHYDNEAMAVEYDLLYRSCLDKKRTFRDEAREVENETKVALVLAPINRLTRQAPASTHIRMIARTKNKISRPIIFREVDLSYDWANADLGRADILLIQRDVVNPLDVGHLLQGCKDRNIQIVLDIDDDLLHVPAEKDPTGKYASSAAGLHNLLTEANLIFASTEHLAAILSPLNNNIEVVPNSLRAQLWRVPLTSGLFFSEQKSKERRCKILYMGSNTHDEDLELIEGAIRTTTEQGLCELYVIGGRASDEEWFNRIEIPNDAKNYTQFVPWFRSLARSFDLAIAPLRDVDFNHSKSDLKILDYAAAKLPICASAGPSYSSDIAREAAFLVAEPSSWQAAIAELCAYPETRQKLARAAYRAVVKDRMEKTGGELIDRLLCCKKAT